MKSIVIREQESGQRADRYLEKYLKNAGKSFIYKMIRKKNITLNGKKFDGPEKLCAGDELKLFFSDETLEKFTGCPLTAPSGEQNTVPGINPDIPDPEILYEDEHILLLNKPRGILTQKAKDTDISLNEQMIAYLCRRGELTEELLRTCRPSVVNRLDRNTSGIVIAGKTMLGLQVMSEKIRNREIDKYYRTIVRGHVDRTLRLDGWLTKEAGTNQVRVYGASGHPADADRILTEAVPIGYGPDWTSLEVKLITGKTHQIRAHLASIGHPVGGDIKYGDESFNRMLRNRYGVRYQMLHAEKIVMPKKMPEPMRNLAGKEFHSALPKEFLAVEKQNVFHGH